MKYSVAERILMPSGNYDDARVSESHYYEWSQGFTNGDVSIEVEYNGGRGKDFSDTDLGALLSGAQGVLHEDVA